MKTGVVILVLSILAGVIASGQSVSLQLINSGGDNFKNTEYQLTWSLGELMTETYSNSSGTLSQGFQQGRYLVTAVESGSESVYDFRVYPNPATDFIILETADPGETDLHFRITNVNGKILYFDIVGEKVQKIDFSRLEKGNYFISVLQKSRILKTFKIIKF